MSSFSRHPTTYCSCTPSRRRMVLSSKHHLHRWTSCFQCFAPLLAGGTVDSSLGVVDFLNNYQQLLRTNCGMFASDKRLTASGECYTSVHCDPGSSVEQCHCCSPSAQMHCTCTAGWSATCWSGVMLNCRLNSERERYTHYHCGCRCTWGVCCSAPVLFVLRTPSLRGMTVRSTT